MFIHGLQSALTICVSYITNLKTFPRGIYVHLDSFPSFFHSLSHSLRGHTPTRPVYISAVTQQFPCTKYPHLVTFNTMTFYSLFMWFKQSIAKHRHSIYVYVSAFYTLNPCTEMDCNPYQRKENSSLTCCSGQIEIFPNDFSLSFPHFSSPPTFSTLPFILPRVLHSTLLTSTSSPFLSCLFMLFHRSIS